MDYKVNDNELIYMVRESDEEARNKIIKKYMPIIKKLAYDYYQAYKEKGAEMDDFIQEGMIALNKAINTYNDIGDVKFYSYACLCIKRNFITFCRNISSKKHYFLNNSLRDEEIYLSCRAKETIFNEGEEKEFIKLKNDFDIKYSLVFELRFNGFSYLEIANLLDIPISTVDSRMNKIKRSLHKLV